LVWTPCVSGPWWELGRGACDLSRGARSGGDAASGGGRPATQTAPAAACGATLWARRLADAAGEPFVPTRERKPRLCQGSDDLPHAPPAGWRRGVLRGVASVRWSLRRRSRRLGGAVAQVRGGERRAPRRVW